MGSEKQQAEDDSAATNLISDGDEKDKKISEQRWILHSHSTVFNTVPEEVFFSFLY